MKHSRTEDITTNRTQKRARRKFNKGIHKIFSKLFTNDIFYHAFIDGEKDPLYDEWKTPPTYATPVSLTGSVNLTLQTGDTEPQEERFDALFRITLMSFQNNNIPIEDREKHPEILKGVITYQDIMYDLIKINPMTYIADMNMTFQIFARERINSEF